MKKWFINYFSNPAEVSFGQRVISIILGVLLFFALALFGFLLVLQFTIFSPDYVASYVDDIDVSASAGEWLDENVAPENPVIAKAVELGITYFEPQIKEQMRFIVQQLYRFLLDRLMEADLDTIVEQRDLVIDVTSNLNVVLDLPVLEPLWESLGVSPDAVEAYINDEQINSYFDAIEQLAEFQNLAIFAHRFYVPLIIIILVLIIAIIFVARRFRLISGILGITFSVYGIIELFTLLPLVSYAKDSVRRLEFHEIVDDLSMRFIGDINQMLMIFSAVILFLGLLLIAAHYLVKFRKTTLST